MTYLPHHPQIYCVGDAQERLASNDRTGNAIALALALGFSLLLLGGEFCLRRELRLAKCGELAEGRIIERKSEKGRNGMTHQIRYLFEAPDGTHSGWQTVSGSLWGNLLNGTPITVLYDPDHPSRHRPSFGFHLVQFLEEND